MVLCNHGCPFFNFPRDNINDLEDNLFSQLFTIFILTMGKITKSSFFVKTYELQIESKDGGKSLVLGYDSLLVCAYFIFEDFWKLDQSIFQSVVLKLIARSGNTDWTSTKRSIERTCQQSFLHMICPLSGSYIFSSRQRLVNQRVLYVIYKWIGGISHTTCVLKLCKSAIIASSHRVQGCVLKDIRTPCETGMEHPDP